MAEDLGPSAGKIRVKITCPLVVIADVEADSVLIPAVKGDFLVVPRKAPMFYLLKEGEVIIHQKDKPDKIYWVSRGVCEVRRDICAMMVWAEEKTSVHVDKIQFELAQGEKVLATLPMGKAREAFKNRMDFYRFVLSKTGN